MIQGQLWPTDIILVAVWIVPQIFPYKSIFFIDVGHIFLIGFLGSDNDDLLLPENWVKIRGRFVRQRNQWVVEDRQLVGNDATDGFDYWVQSQAIRRRKAAALRGEQEA